MGAGLKFLPFLKSPKHNRVSIELAIFPFTLSISLSWAKMFFQYDHSFLCFQRDALILRWIFSEYVCHCVDLDHSTTHVRMKACKP